MVDNKKGAKVLEAPEKSEGKSSAKDNQYFWPINYINLTRFCFDSITFKEIALLTGLMVKSGRYGNDFDYSIARAKQELGFDKKTFGKAMMKFESMGIITRKTVKANKQLITVHFDELKKKRFLEYILKDPSKSLNQIIEDINGFEKKCKMREFEKKEKGVEKEVIMITSKQVEKLIDRLSFMLEIRKGEVIKKESSFEETSVEVKLFFTNEQKKRLKKAMIVFSEDQIMNSATAYFDAIMDADTKLFIKINSIAGYFLTINDSGNFSQIMYWLDQYNITFTKPYDYMSDPNNFCN